MVYFKELAYATVGPGESEICRAGSRPETQVGFLCCSLEAELLFLYLLFRPSTDWAQPTTLWKAIYFP